LEGSVFGGVVLINKLGKGYIGLNRMNKNGIDIRILFFNNEKVRIVVGLLIVMS
jgi:hypothetical protein